MLDEDLRPLDSAISVALQQWTYRLWGLPPSKYHHQSSLHSWNSILQYMQEHELYLELRLKIGNWQGSSCWNLITCSDSRKLLTDAAAYQHTMLHTSDQRAQCTAREMRSSDKCLGCSAMTAVISKTLLLPQIRHLIWFCHHLINPHLHINARTQQLQMHSITSRQTTSEQIYNTWMSRLLNASSKCTVDGISFTGLASKEDMCSIVLNQRRSFGESILTPHQPLQAKCHCENVGCSIGWRITWKADRDCQKGQSC